MGSHGFGRENTGNAPPVCRMAKMITTGLFFLVLSSLPRETLAAVVWPRISLPLRTEGLVQPVQITNAGDGSGKLYLVEQAGRIRTFRNGTLRSAPFLDIGARVLSGGERGLLGLAFPPGFATKRYFYVNYTRNPDGATVIARYRLTQDPDAADPASEEVLLVVDQPFANHNGGQLAFGPDGFLYIGMGDGGSGGDPQGNAQNPASLLGKMLRVDVEGGTAPYAIPPGNPFAGSAEVRGEVWALGLRNPWRFSFDIVTGDLYIGDVGQASFEEVDFQPVSSAGGGNYGWNVMEGSSCFGGSACNPADYVLPVAEYDHSGGRCSVTGGTVYRGEAYPGMRGIYFYGDFCTGEIFGLTRDGSVWEKTLLLDTPIRISSFGTDEAGNLYATDHAGGALYEIVENSPPSSPALLSPPLSFFPWRSGHPPPPASVTFQWNPSVDPDGDPVTYLFFLDTDPSFAGTVPVPVSGPAGQTVQPREAHKRFGILAFGIAMSALLGRRNRIRGAAVLLIVSAALSVWAGPGCGGGGGGTMGTSQDAIVHTESGLFQNTTYHWKVAAGDGTAFSESDARSFSTGSP